MTWEHAVVAAAGMCACGCVPETIETTLPYSVQFQVSYTYLIQETKGDFCMLYCMVGGLPMR